MDKPFRTKKFFKILQKSKKLRLKIKIHQLLPHRAFSPSFLDYFQLSYFFGERQTTNLLLLFGKVTDS